MLRNFYWIQLVKIYTEKTFTQYNLKKLLTRNLDPSSKIFSILVSRKNSRKCCAGGKQVTLRTSESFFLIWYWAGAAANIEKRHFFVYLLKGSTNGIRTHLNLAAKKNRK